MKQVARQLFLGVFLIVVASAVLLLSDLGSRTGFERREHTGMPRVAVVQPTKQTIFDEGVRGIIHGLQEEGFIHDKNMFLREFNPAGDSNLANAIAQDVTGGQFDLIVTVTTPSLQSVANANKDRRIRHIFSLIADPVALNVGVKSLNTPDHPEWMTGYGTRIPIASAIRLAHEINPSIKVIGTVWNSSEVNSVVQLVDARAVCKELGIRLIEANVTSSADVLEATASLLPRGIDMLLIPGDITVMSAIQNAIQTATKAGIPSVSVFPSDTEKGLLFAVGADYYEVGKQTGRLAAEVLRGRDPKTIPVVNYLPEKIALNQQVHENLKHPERWVFPEELIAKAYLVKEKDGGIRYPLREREAALKGDGAQPSGENATGGEKQ
jgi:ABC-type uncharacterized transport system substrate-binding protein